MTIHIIKNGIESGPFTWGEVFLMLQKCEISLNDMGRMDPVSNPIPLSDFHLWGEGDEVGPFSWDDIAILLKEGFLDPDVEARFETEEQKTRLSDLILRSEEIELVQPQHPEFRQGQWVLPWVSRFLDFLPRPAPTVSVLAIILLTLAAILVFRPSRPSSDEQTTAAEGSELSADISSPSKKRESEHEILATAQDSAPHVESSAQDVHFSETETATTPQVQEETSNEFPAAAPASDITKMVEPIETLPAPQEAPVLASLPVQPNSLPPPAHVGTPSTPSHPVSPAPLAEVAQPTPRITSTPTPAQASSSVVSVRDFFKIESIKLLKKPPKDGVGVWIAPTVDGKPGKPVFRPSLEVKVSTRENTRSDKTIAKAYFYNSDNTPVASLNEPSKAGASSRSAHSAPVIFYKDKPDRLFFEIPDKVENSQWKAIVVFGDKHEVQALPYPSTASAFLLEYPEKELVNQKSAPRVARRPALDPLIEHVVKTKNPRMPQMTLFFRPPRNVTDSSEIRGVLALCLLAGSLDGIRRELQKEEMSGDNRGVLGFADRNKLAILAWGANTSLWARANYDQLTKQQAREYEASFSIVANAWERGVLELGEKYGMPTKGFLIQGQCGSAHLAKALCLAKPDYFLAIHIHIPGFFEAPTPEASRVLWCITTGELYYSYEYSLRFLEDSRKMGYPILYKAFVGLGHSGHPDATALGLEFFQFALTQQPLIEDYMKKKSSQIDSLRLAQIDGSGPWLDAFKNPPLYGDVINQEVFPSDQMDMIPESFRVPIPTKELGAIWKRNP